MMANAEDREMNTRKAAEYQAIADASVEAGKAETAAGRLIAAGAHFRAADTFDSEASLHRIKAGLGI